MRQGTKVYQSHWDLLCLLPRLSPHLQTRNGPPGWGNESQSEAKKRRFVCESVAEKRPHLWPHSVGQAPGRGKHRDPVQAGLRDLQHLATLGVCWNHKQKWAAWCVGAYEVSKAAAPGSLCTHTSPRQQARRG